jgi:two-component system, LytTR family, sensor kinase
VPALTFLGIFSAVGLVQASAVRVGLDAAASPIPPLTPFLFHLTGAIAAWTALPVVQTSVLNAPGPRVGILRMIAVHAAGYVAFALVHISVMLTLRMVVQRAFSIPIPQPVFIYRVLWEAQSDLVLYAGIAALWSLLSAWRERHEASLRAAQLEAKLASARLDALAAQLDPHFLFNALHTVSSLMYTDLARTEQLLADLGAILRATLGPPRATWTFAEEREHSERYIALLLARFGDRLAIEWKVDEGLEETQLPRFAIQTLVENAVKHNRDREEKLVVAIEVRKGDGIHISVADDGCGFEERGAQRDPERGLGRLEETLRLLHAELASLECGASAQGGAKVELHIPEGPST